jgi:diacylglycerol O-acyltransferase
VVNSPDPLARLQYIQHQTGAAKRDRRGAAWPLVMRVMASMPGFAHRLLARMVTGRVNLICTNIPGPPMQRYLAGAKIEAMYPFAPVALGTPVSFALMSYGDTYGVGIDSDAAAIPDPQLLTQYLTAAIDEIEDRVFPHPARKRQQQDKRRAGREAG